ncbi:STM4015 family protein [Nocardiopsis sp. CC223A]|uniref:STM4015 family protein n=1 Tax=Nocardiopsis sp. CC223A TaxID=3044051 RepID=UPI00278BFE60|nr:STM4015 family protein [Nocardiopsis sp. CC223A]
MCDPLPPNEALLTGFGGLPVVEFPRAELEPPDRLPAPGAVAWRLRANVDRGLPWEGVVSYVGRFCSEVDPAAVSALVVGNFPGEDGGLDWPVEDLVFTLAEAAHRWSGLRSLFFGDILRSENEMSWIVWEDLGPLVAALPELRQLTVRGGSTTGGLCIREHTRLAELTVQSAGLTAEVAEEVCASGLPALRRLELWTGSTEYGGVTPKALEPLLTGEAFPDLEHLGLRNSQGLDAWIPVLAEAPVVAGAGSLDLSLGDLTDRGGRAVIRHASAFAHLERLDLHHHFLSEEVQAGIRAALPRVDVDLSAPQEPEVDDHDDPTEFYYYTAVAE